MSLPPLPPLPIPNWHSRAEIEQWARTYAEQYGRLCADAERAEILALVESFQREVSPIRGKQIADAIRARGAR